MKTLSLILLIVTGNSYSNSIKAQQTLSINLKQAVQMALDSNLSVRSSLYSVEVQKAMKCASWDIPKTNIDGQYGQFNSYSKDNSFTISQSFAFPTVYVNQHKLAQANVKSSEWLLKSSKLEIVTHVKQLYWQLAYLYSKQKLIVYQDSLYSGFQKAAELRLKTGETNRLEMISARSQSLEIKNQLRQIQVDLSICNQKLQNVLNVETTLYPADTVLHRIEYFPAPDNSSLTGNPSVGYVNQQLEVSRLEKKLESSRILPDLSIGYYSQTIRGSQEVKGIPRTFGPGDRFTGIQAGIAVPIWFVAYSAKTKVAKFKEKIAQTDAEYYSKSLSGNFRSLKLELSKNSNSVDYYEKQAVPEADLIIDQASKSYKAGAMDYLEYILCLDRALSIKQNYLNALNNYNQNIISLDFITGKIL